MGRLARTSLLSALVLVAACQTISTPRLLPPSITPEPGKPGAGDGFLSAVGDVRTSPPSPTVHWQPGEVPMVPVSSLDLEAWPFGWVMDDQAQRLGLAGRFWSDQKPLWRQGLDPLTPPAAAVRKLEGLFRTAGSADEGFRAAWRLWMVYRQAALPVEAREWLDRADHLRPGPVSRLERAWDQAFRLKDDWGARALWSGIQGPWTSGDDRKARLLRQHLFLGSKNLAEVGADGYVATLVLDRDDLWIGTWNGAVVRWSLAADTLDLVLSPGPTVAPVKLLKTTGWFVYAFKDQSLLRYSKVTGTWRTFPYPPGWTGLRVQSVVADGQESLWVAYLGQGLWRWNQGEWILVDDGGGGPFLNALAPDGQGGFWVGTKDRGLWSWKDGAWTPVPSSAPAPDNISVIEADPDAARWAVGTWGEGTWVLEDGRLKPASGGKEFVVGATWSEGSPLWGTLDEGLLIGEGAPKSVLGPRDGLPAGGVSALVTWEGRWIWGTAGQGLGWWNDHENSALLR